MRFAFPISKTETMEDGRLLIEGVATSESLDCQGDILDFDGSKRAFEKWRGNLREAHDPRKPIGKAIEVIHDDDGKTISVRAFISAGAKDTQEKVKDGTLSMFSVGGGAPTKTKMEKSGGKSIRRVLEWPMTELSLVDVGANPDAAVSVLKAAGMDEEEEKPPAEGENPAADLAESKEAEQSPEEKKDEPVQLSEAQMTELVTKITDAVLASLEAKKKEDPASPPAPTPEQKPQEKSVPEPAIRKDEEADVLSAALLLDSLKNLRCCEGTEPEIETKQLACLARCAAALAEFIALEAGEVVTNAVADPEMLCLSAKIDGLSKAVADMTESLGAIQKSAPVPDPRLDDVVAGIGSMPASIASELSKTASDLKAAFSGEVKALREGEIAKLAKATDQILAMPVPGRSPLRNFAAAQGLMEKSAPSETNKANVLRSAAQGAPPSVRDYLLNEASAIERS